jgi:hypothetical protein
MHLAPRPKLPMREHGIETPTINFRTDVTSQTSSIVVGQHPPTGLSIRTIPNNPIEEYSATPSSFSNGTVATLTGSNLTLVGYIF